MTIKINGIAHDGMQEASKRLGISRATLKRYIDNGFFTQPKWHRQGVKQKVRYFDEAWYRINEKKLKAERSKD